MKNHVFKVYGYTVALAGINAHNGPILAVTRENHGGKYMQGEDAKTWYNAIITAIDKQEARALCAAIYRGE